jgi:uncharacterized protein
MTGVMTVAKLNFQVMEIPEEGLDLADEVLPDELSLLPEEAQVRGLLSLSARLTHVGDHVYVEGVIDGTFVRECVRCLTPYETYTEVPLVGTYQVSDPAARARGRAAKDRSQKPDEETVEVSDEKDDLYVCSGDRVDLAEMLREHLILSTPMQPLCREDCRGLCPVCGQNRNEQSCNCREGQPNNPFAILQERLKKSP